MQHATVTNEGRLLDATNENGPAQNRKAWGLAAPQQSTLNTPS